MDVITWTNDTRRLSDLVPWEHNPKRMTRKQAEGLRLSIERFGFAVPFLVSPDGEIYDGHQREALMKAMRNYGPNAVVDVRVSSRPLTDDERRELVIRLKQNQAGWDFDMLPNLYDKEELIEWGFEPEELGMFSVDSVWVIGAGDKVDKGDRSGSSPWDRVKGSNDVRCLVGDVEFSLPKNIVKQWFELLSKSEIPIREAAQAWFLENML